MLPSWAPTLSITQEGRDCIHSFTETAGERLGSEACVSR